MDRMPKTQNLARSFFRKIMGYFFQGMLFLAPIGLTAYLAYWLFANTDNGINSILPESWQVPGLGILIAALCITVLGYLSSKIIFNIIFDNVDDLLERVPVVRVIYTSARDFMEAFLGKEILHVNVFRKNDDRTTYNLVYQDGKTGPYYVKRFIRVAGQTQNAIKLVFADGNNIYGKEFDFNGVMVSDKTSASINGSMENDKVRYAASEIYYWYDNFFLSYGIQRIKNTKDEDVKRKRNVLFVNKIKFE